MKPKPCARKIPFRSAIAGSADVVPSQEGAQRAENPNPNAAQLGRMKEEAEDGTGGHKQAEACRGCRAPTVEQRKQGNLRASDVPLLTMTFTPAPNPNNPNSLNPWP